MAELGSCERVMRNLSAVNEMSKLRDNKMPTEANVGRM